jgi:ribonucleoside-triphosphate reductase
LDSDKKQNILEQQLKTLGQKIRIDILKKLNNTATPLPFSKLQKDVLGNDLTSINLSFHLNTLKKSDLIQSSDDGYSITSLGEQIIERILSIEQILNKQNRTLMIRTSKYSKEVFDINKIEEYLVREGELERYLARQIAHVVEERLSKTNIEYMTTPLMREYINAILLENGLEEVRHKLTRLGTPPFEAFKLFDSQNDQITPYQFIEKLGSDVSEQFLLLNLIPRNLADLYLSGEIALLHLNYWALRPLSLYINTKTLVAYLFKKYGYHSNKNSKSMDNLRMISQFLDTLYKLKQFYSEDLLLGNFNSQFLSYFTKSRTIDISLLLSQYLRFTNLRNGENPSLSLEFDYNGKLDTNSLNQFQIDLQFLKVLDKNCKGRTKPLIIFELTSYPIKSEINNILNTLTTDSFKDSVILYNKAYSKLLNSAFVKISNSKEEEIILDKILVNLHKISVEAKQDDELFLKLLENRVNSVIELFNYKEKLVQKKLNSLKMWNSVVKKILNRNTKDLIKKSTRSISFFGLNEAILNHCGIELDRTETSQNFALKILTLMKEIIEERNEDENNNYILSQPHKDSYLRNSWNNEKEQNKQKMKNYCLRIIRSEANLSLNKRITLFKRFQKIINGGTLFMEKKPVEMPFQKYLDFLINSEIGAISLGDCIP